MSIGPIGSRLAASQSKVVIGDPLSSGLESIRSGISQATQKGGIASIKDALQLFHQGKSFSPTAARKFGRTAMAKFGHANPPHHFFKQLASAKGVPFGKFQPQELVRNLTDPSLKLQEGLKGLASNIQKSMDSIHQRLQASKTDPNAMVQSAMRESYQENLNDLKMYANKVQSLNDAKKEIREGFQTTSTDVQKAAQESTIDTLSRKDQFDEHIQKLEGELQSVGDDAQLANVDMQNILQKQQQSLQLMSNTAKLLHETAQQIIRKLGG